MPRMSLGKKTVSRHTHANQDAPTGHIISKDVRGPFHATGLHGEKYFTTFSDLGSRFKCIIPRKSLAVILVALEASIKYRNFQCGAPPPFFTHTTPTSTYKPSKRTFLKDWEHDCEQLSHLIMKRMTSQKRPAER